MFLLLLHRILAFSLKKVTPPQYLIPLAFPISIMLIYLKNELISRRLASATITVISTLSNIHNLRIPVRVISCSNRIIKYKVGRTRILLFLHHLLIISSIIIIITFLLHNNTSNSSKSSNRMWLLWRILIFFSNNNNNNNNSSNSSNRRNHLSLKHQTSTIRRQSESH